MKNLLTILSLALIFSISAPTLTSCDSDSDNTTSSSTSSKKKSKKKKRSDSRSDASVEASAEASAEANYDSYDDSRSSRSSSMSPSETVQNFFNYIKRGKFDDATDLINLSSFSESRIEQIPEILSVLNGCLQDGIMEIRVGNCEIYGNKASVEINGYENGEYQGNATVTLRKVNGRWKIDVL